MLEARTVSTASPKSQSLISATVGYCSQTVLASKCCLSHLWISNVMFEPFGDECFTDSLRMLQVDFERNSLFTQWGKQYRTRHVRSQYPRENKVTGQGPRHPRQKLSASATAGAGSSPARDSGKATSGAGSRCREHPETGSPEGRISTSCTVPEREALGSSSQSFLGFMGHFPTGWSPPHLKIMHLWSPFWQFWSVQVPKLKP